ncbi:MAG: hypothetical protein ACRC8E_04100 [Plesiomonas shigelloides]
MSRSIATLIIISSLLYGCGQAETPTAPPDFQEQSIIAATSATPLRTYTLEDGHGIYFMAFPRASIEFRNKPERINISLYLSEEDKAKNEPAIAIVKSLASKITGTNGEIVDDAINGNITGKKVINGITTNVSVVGQSILITFYK